MQQPTIPYVPVRGRPSKKQVAAIDRSILDAATRLFLEAGSFDAVSMETVAFVASVSKPTLYARYQNKEELLRAVVRDRIAFWKSGSAVEDVSDATDSSSRLRVFARTIALSLASPEVRALQRVIYSVGDRFPAISKTLLDDGFLHGIETFAAEIGSIPGKNYRDPKAVAAIITSALIGWQSSRWHEELTTRDLFAFADKTVTLLIGGEDSW